MNENSYLSKDCFTWQHTVQNGFNKETIVLLLCIFCLFYQALFSQSYSSKNNYTGSWETPTSWTPTWIVPQTDLLFNGY